MGFNFGAFAGGVASGYEAASKLRIQQEEQKNKRDALVAKMAKEQKAALNAAKNGLSDNQLAKAKATIQYQKDLADATTAEEHAGLTNAYDTQMAAFDDKTQVYTDQLAELNPTEDQVAEVANAESEAVGKAVETTMPEVTQRSSSIVFNNKSYAGNTQATNFLKMRMKAPNGQETTRVNDNTYEVEVKDKDGKWQSAGFEPLRYFPPETAKDSSTEMERAFQAYNKRTGKNIPIEEFKQKFWSPKSDSKTIRVSDMPSQAVQDIFLAQEGVTGESEISQTLYNKAAEGVYLPNTASKSISKAAMVDVVTNLEVRQAEGEELTLAETIKLKNYKKYIETEGDVKRDLNLQAGEILDHFTITDPHFKNIKQEDINKLAMSEKNVGFKVDATFAKEIIDAETTIFGLDRLQKKLQPLKDEEAERGLIDSVKLKVQTIISDENWAELPEEEKRKHLLTVGLNTSIGAALADYIKSISGTAVAEAEYNRLMNVLTAGDYSNIQTLKETIGMFTDDLKAKYYNKLGSNFLHKGSFVLNKMNQYNKKFGDIGKPIAQVGGYDVYDDGAGKGAYIWYNGKKKYTKKKGK